jgi:hypothetical protein
MIPKTSSVLPYIAQHGTIAAGTHSTLKLTKKGDKIRKLKSPCIKNTITEPSNENTIKYINNVERL